MSDLDHFERQVLAFLRRAWWRSAVSIAFAALAMVLAIISIVCWLLGR